MFSELIRYYYILENVVVRVIGRCLRKKTLTPFLPYLSSPNFYRAILKGSPLLLCDEPTSSLDSKTESDIMSNLKEVGKDVTTIIIAHRLSTIQDANQIIVLDKGVAVETGNHNELIAKGGLYSRMWAVQQMSQ